MKNKTIRKILAFVMLTILLVQFALTIVVFAKDEESIEYSNAWNDLNASSLFNPTDYPKLPSSHEKYYSLEVITVAESENGELFIYVYQPSGQAGEIRATSIDISITERNDKKEFLNYELTYVNSYGVFFKYKVEDLKVSKDEIRYYEISDILRPWSESYGDKKPGAGNTVSEVAYPVGKFFTFSGKSMQKVEDIEYITITDQYLGFVRYEQDTSFAWLPVSSKACDSHFIAFSTDKVIDNLLEISIIFESLEVGAYLNSENKYEYISFGESKNRRVVIDFEDELYLDLADGSVFTKQPLLKYRIQKTSDFINQDLHYSYFGSFEQHEKVDFKDEALLKLMQTKWVVSFAETLYSVSDLGSGEDFNYTQVGNVKVMRLKFETNGQIYNLGVVSNKQTGSKDPVAVVEEQEWWQKIMMVLMLILLLLALIFVWPFISPVIKIIWQGIKGIFKVLIWILMLPSKLFRKIFKLSDKRADQRRKKGKVKK